MNSEFTQATKGGTFGVVLDVLAVRNDEQAFGSTICNVLPIRVFRDLLFVGI